VVSTPIAFLFSHPAHADRHTLSLHDALPIYTWSRSSTPTPMTLPSTQWLGSGLGHIGSTSNDGALTARSCVAVASSARSAMNNTDRKSTRLNSSHDQISYAVFCLKKKKQTHT